MMNKTTPLAAGLATMILALSTAGCVNPSERIAMGLDRYGLDQRQSQCVGNRLSERLSLGQLQQLGRVARAFTKDDTTPGRLTASDFVRVSAQIKDPRVPIEVTKAAAGCGVLASAVPGG